MTYVLTCGFLDAVLNAALLMEEAYFPKEFVYLTLGIRYSTAVSSVCSDCTLGCNITRTGMAPTNLSWLCCLPSSSLWTMPEAGAEMC